MALKYLDKIKALYIKITNDLRNLEPKKAEQLNRVIFGLIMAIIAITAIVFGGIIFIAMILMITIIMTDEWIRIGSTIKEIAPQKWLLYGLVYIGMPLISCIYIRLYVDCGHNITLWYTITIGMVDTVSYIIGTTIGGKKITKISPNKTLSGYIGGSIAGIISSSIIIWLIMHKVSSYIVLSISIVILAQLGDLVESYIKRKSGIKDSGSMIPAHGGLLDRLDSYIFVCPTIAIISMLNGGTLCW